MSNKNPIHPEDRDRLVEYDFSNGVRGKYAERARAGTNMVLLERDVAEEFHGSAGVNEALRMADAPPESNE